MNARERILGKLRAAAPPFSLPEPRINATPHDFATTFSQAELSRQLTDRLRAARAEVIDTTLTDWPDELASLCRRKGIRTLLVAPGAPSTPAVAEAMPKDAPVMFDRPIEHWKQRLFREIDAGFTEASVALANVGALVMKTGPTEPRTLSLIPSIHVILVRESRIYFDLATAARSERWAASMPSNLVLVSGPSKTSDIQQTLAFGAHGPKELIVLIAHGGTNND